MKVYHVSDEELDRIVAQITISSFSVKYKGLLTLPVEYAIEIVKERRESIIDIIQEIRNG